MTESLQVESSRGREAIRNGSEKAEIEAPTNKSKEKRRKKEETVDKDIIIMNNKIEEVKSNVGTKEEKKPDSGKKRLEVCKEERGGKHDGRRKSGEGGTEGRRKSGEGGTEGRRKSGEGGCVPKVNSDGTRRGSMGRPQIKIPYLAQIERRISMDLLDYSGKMEGLKLIRELNRETSHYRHLVVALGGSSDCEQLRDDLKRSRQRAGDLVRQAKAKILPCLQDIYDDSPRRPNRFSNSDRKEAKRLCKLLFYCIRVLEQELVRSLALQSAFTLHTGNQNLINTGVNEYLAGHKGSPPAQGTDQVLKERLLAEKNEVLHLQKEASELRSFLHKSEGSPGVKSWTMEDFGERQFLHTILEDSDPSSVSSPASPFPNPESNNSDQESLADSFREKLHHRKCLCWIFASLLTTLLLASLLGTLISFLAS